MNNYEDLAYRISQRIKTLRKEQGLTVQELAYRCDIERSNLSRIEAGRSNLTLKTMCIICNALKIKLKDLIDVS
ncbi:MAG: helix-turn-helix transcriptional regulator [Rikenellaceae bacterium]|nr:helix-turn-helix transcriptional regulator [Rikenellaceae bacterium]MBQ6690885.1 helix-turn-helix transcriptional regulator [Rikenellaceae bacterium]MBQ8745726.1 helix-turn-helix transcriptional regulator [Rikenellaceae bacterium]